MVKYGKKKLFEICYKNSECLSNNCSNVSGYTGLKKCYEKPTVIPIKSGYISKKKKSLPVVKSTVRPIKSGYIKSGYIKSGYSR